MNIINKSTAVRMFCGLLAVLTVAGFAACGGKDGETVDSTGTQTDTAESATEVTETEYIPEYKDFGGRKVTILRPQERYYDVAEEQNGEVVNDAIFTRDSKLSEMFGVTFENVLMTDGWDTRAQYNGHIASVVQAGDPTYDYIYGIEVCTIDTLSTGYFFNLLEYDELKLENEWWLGEQAKTLGLAGKLYGVFGASTLDIYKEIAILFANTAILTNNGIDLPYKSVLAGSWTVDEFMNNAITCTADLNGDGVYKITDDIIGSVGRHTSARSWQGSLDIQILDLDKNGEIVFYGMTDRLAKAVDITADFFASGSIYSVIDANDIGNLNAFASGNVLYYCERLIQSELLRDMEDDFAIIPLPKLDESQENYITQGATATCMILIPVTASDPNMSAMIMEASTYYGWGDILPKYYEVALKEKFLRDANNKQVLDMVTDSIRFNITFAYCNAIGGDPWPNQVWITSTLNGRDPASSVAANEAKWLGNIEKIIEQYKQLP